jgi:tripartite-type tricarboxylate transporter receptor subunit TctC
MKFITHLSALVLFAAGLTPSVHAQSNASNFPNKPIKIVVGYTAGGAVDLIARSIAQAMQSSLGQAIIVENKPGAGTNIAVKSVIDAPADGYTLMLAANALAANMALYQPAPFDAERQLVAIGQVGKVPVVIAGKADGGFANITSVLAAAKGKPNAVAYASPGNGSTPHMAVEFFARAAGVDLQHIPYRGGSQAITDVLGGQVPLVAVNALEVQPHLKSGKLKVLAVLSNQRTAIFPDSPTIAESNLGPALQGFEAAVWYGLVAPAATPKDIVVKLHAELQKALQTKEVRERLQSSGGEVVAGSAEQFATLIKTERQRYEKLVREANIKPD